MNRFVVISILAACGSPGDMSDDDVLVDAMATHLDANQCATFAQSAATAATTCGTPLPTGGQASIEQWCRKGVTTGGRAVAAIDAERALRPRRGRCVLANARVAL